MYHGQYIRPIGLVILRKRQLVFCCHHFQMTPVAMITLFNGLKDVVNIVSHGQTPVTACDQPLYKIAKDIQWT